MFKSMRIEKYIHQNGNNTEYVIQLDNNVLQLSSLENFNAAFYPECGVISYSTLSQARRMFVLTCDKLEKEGYKRVESGKRWNKEMYERF